MASVTGASNRLVGLFSGLDTDSLVKTLVSTQQRKVDQLFQTRQRAEWKRDSLTDFNNKLRIFRENYISVTGSGTMGSQSTFYSNKVDLAANNYLSVTASSTAAAGRFSVKIDRIATAASMTGTRATNSETGLSQTDLEKTAISSLTQLRSGTYDSGDSFSFTINGKEFAFNATDTLKTVMDTVNKSGAGVTMSYSQTTDSFKIVSNYTGSYQGLSDPGEAPQPAYTFDLVKPVLADYASEDDYNAALDGYNAAKEEYDATVGGEYREAYAEWSKASAAYQEDMKRSIDFGDSDGFLSYLGLTEVTAGTDARVSVNGSEMRTFKSNAITLDGVTFNLLAPTEVGKTIDFGVTRDSSAAAEKVKTFVESFNSLLSDIHTALNTKKNYSYDPLTDEQRAELTEKEAELWDEKAKAGILYRDSSLSALYNQLREMVSTKLGDGYLKDIGITVSKYAVGEPFKLEIDSDKLTKALEDDPEKVYRMFASAASGTDKGGLMTRMGASITDFTNKTKSVDLQNLNNSIDSLTKQMKTQGDKITVMSEKYYLQYAALETALQKLQSQQDQMSSLFGTSSS